MSYSDIAYGVCPTCIGNIDARNVGFVTNVIDEAVLRQKLNSALLRYCCCIPCNEIVGHYLMG